MQAPPSFIKTKLEQRSIQIIVSTSVYAAIPASFSSRKINARAATETELEVNVLPSKSRLGLVRGVFGYSIVNLKVLWVLVLQWVAFSLG